MAQKEDWRDKVHELISRVMCNHDITQNELARRANIHKSKVSNLFTKMKKNATFEDYVPLFEALDYPVLAAYIFISSRNKDTWLCSHPEYYNNASRLWLDIRQQLDDTQGYSPSEDVASLFCREFKHNLREWPHTCDADGWTESKLKLLVHRLNKTHRYNKLRTALI